jgi:hypothetical protein
MSKEEIKKWVVKALEDFRAVEHELRLPEKEVIYEHRLFSFSAVCRKNFEGLFDF